MKEPSHSPGEIGTRLERDPVCGMRVDPRRAAGTVEHAGKDYYFCSIGCRDKFKAAPEKFLSSSTLKPANTGSSSPLIGIAPATTKKILAPANVHTSEQLEYTCPMHPE